MARFVSCFDWKIDNIKLRRRGDCVSFGRHVLLWNSAGRHEASRGSKGKLQDVHLQYHCHWFSTGTLLGYHRWVTTMPSFCVVFPLMDFQLSLKRHASNFEKKACPQNIFCTHPDKEVQKKQEPAQCKIQEPWLKLNRFWLSCSPINSQPTTILKSLSCTFISSHNVAGKLVCTPGIGTKKL